MLSQCRPTWSVDAFEPYISTKAMSTHVNTLHQGYIRKLNQKFGYSDLLRTPPSYVLNSLNAYVDFEDAKFYRNQMGGNVAHTLFWQCLSPTANNSDLHTRLPFGLTKKELFDKIVKLGVDQFGSGWVWGFVNPRKNFEFGMTNLRDHDTPYMRGNIPIFCVDVWEHAYFIDFLSDREQWLRTVCQFLDLDVISTLYTNVKFNNVDLLDDLVLGDN